MTNHNNTGASAPVTTYNDLVAKKAALDQKVSEEREATGTVSLTTAFAWWDVATTVRDYMRWQ